MKSPLRVSLYRKLIDVNLTRVHKPASTMVTELSASVITASQVRLVCNLITHYSRKYSVQAYSNFLYSIMITRLCIALCHNNERRVFHGVMQGGKQCWHKAFFSTLWVKKLDPFSFEHNFRKYCPILIILSLLQTEIICPQTCNWICHFTYSLLLHYLQQEAQLSLTLTNRAMLVCKVVEVWQDFLSEYVDKKFTYICYRRCDACERGLVRILSLTVFQYFKLMKFKIEFYIISETFNRHKINNEQRWKQNQELVETEQNL